MYFKAQSFSNTSAIKMIHLNWNPETKVELKIEDVGQKSLMCAALGTRLTSQGDKSLSWQGFPPTRSPNPLVNAVLPAAREHAHTNTHTYTHTLCPSPQPYGNANWDLDLKQSFWSFYKWEKWGSKLHLIAQDYNLLSKDPATQLSSLLFLLFLTAQENQIAKSGKMEGSLCGWHLPQWDPLQGGCFRGDPPAMVFLFIFRGRNNFFWWRCVWTVT